MPKETIFSKLKYKDYNDILEQVLEKKDFPVLGKNLILSILYKMETNYNDYRTVKRDVSEKEKILEDFINIVKNYCDSLTVIKPDSKRRSRLKEKQYIVNKENKKLEAFANEKNVLKGLYGLYNNENMVNSKYGILADAIKEILEKGNANNNIELLRDFNGYSWYVSSAEFEDIYSNLIFQNIRIIAGNEILEEWLHNNDNKKDYIQVLKKELVRRYGKEMADEFIEQLFITILKLYLEERPEKLKEIKNTKKVTKQPEDIRKYIEKITEEKKELLKKVEKLDICINDEEKMKKEISIRRKEGKELNNLEEFKEKLIIERKKCMNKILEYNKIMDPRNLLKNKTEQKDTKETSELFNYKELAKSNTTAYEELLNLQKIFLKSYKILADKLVGKKEILELIYEFRYYNLIPITKRELVRDNEELRKDIDDMRFLLVGKAQKEKILNTVNNNKYLNMEILKDIFSLRIINLENTEVNVQKTDLGVRINYLDGDLEEISKDIIVPDSIGKYKVKENKKIKIFS